MYLKRLEIHGFKSFAHKTVLDFDPGMTAVVGPNGSGKSNVADSIRWVMGEQSLKLLRGKKSEDVIFAGSDKKSKLSMAEVALTFDNVDHKMPLEYSEVVITRRLFRDGESDYLINGQKVRLLDVVDALMRSGFGASNYAVIGQGTIDQMVLAGPAEIKNLVEEASGVKPYYLKREKTLRRLETTEENLSKVSALVQEIEPRLRSLRRQAKRMEEREAVVNELVELQLQYFGNQFYLQETDLNAVILQLELKNKVIKELESDINIFQSGLEKEEQQQRAAANFNEELAKKISNLEDRRFHLQEQLAEVRGKLKADLVPGQVDLKSLSVEKLDYERQIELTSQKLKEANDKLSEAKKQIEEIKPKLHRLPVNFTEFERKFDELLESLTIANLEETKQKLKQLVKNLNAGSSSVKEDLIEQLHSLELKVVEYSTFKQNYENNISAWTNKLNQIKTILNRNPEQFKNELFKQEESLSKNLEDLMSQMDQLKQTQTKVFSDEREKKSFLSAQEKKFRGKSAQLSELKEEQSKILVEKAKLDTRLEVLAKESKDALGESIGELGNFKTAEFSAEIVNRIEKLKHQLELTGGVDEATLSEYKETEERFNYLTSQSKDLSQAVVDLRSVITELDQIIKKQFSEAFEKISEKFTEYFRILFNGGRAQMTLVKAQTAPDLEAEALDEESEQEIPFDGIKQKKPIQEIAGIEIRATPPGKKLASIAALSGGERALTAIALLCSMLACYPSPFVVLDEVDAALDEANSIRFAKILGTLAHQTQFVTITHNRETMRQAHTLYGVTMDDNGVSKILSLKLEKAEAIAE